MPFWRKESSFKSSLYKPPKAPPKVDEVLPPGKYVIKRGTSEKGAERLTNRNFGINCTIVEGGGATLDCEDMIVALLMDIRERLDHLISNTEPVTLTTDEDLIDAAQEVFYSPTKEYWANIDKQIKSLTAP